MVPELSPREGRRLALAKAGLLKPEWTRLPLRAPRGEQKARDAAHRIISRFGYLQLDTVSIAGARSHVLVLLSRLPGFSPELGEALLQPGEPLFEYWGHEASWLPIDLYPALAMRRRAFRKHPWWGDIIGAHRGLARDLLKRIRDEGPLRALDLEGKDEGAWWGHRPAKRVAVALWSSGDLAIRSRRNFQRTYDLPERVIPEGVRKNPLSRPASFRILLLKALEGHGWAELNTLAATWRFNNIRDDLLRALGRLEREGKVTPADLLEPGGRRRRGWIRTEDLDLLSRLEKLRPRSDWGVLLSPFDPLLWDRNRVQLLFGFEQVLEIFKPKEKRIYGYYCLPVLAGERLIARVDLKADRTQGRLQVLSRRFESTGTRRPGNATEAEGTATALSRYANQVGLSL